jgi:hypothetical protein
MALSLGTKLCNCCKQRKPIKGGAGGKFKPFVCAECKGKAVARTA